MIVLCTFARFWYKFHLTTRQGEINKAHCEVYWNSIISNESKLKLIESIKPGFKTKLTALQYLKKHLKY